MGPRPSTSAKELLAVRVLPAIGVPLINREPVGLWFGGTLLCSTNSNTSSVKGLAMPTTSLRRLSATSLLSPP